MRSVPLQYKPQPRAGLPPPRPSTCVSFALALRQLCPPKPRGTFRFLSDARPLSAAFTFAAQTASAAHYFCRPAGGSHRCCSIRRLLRRLALVGPFSGTTPLETGGAAHFRQLRVSFESALAPQAPPNLQICLRCPAPFVSAQLSPENRAPLTAAGSKTSS